MLDVKCILLKSVTPYKKLKIYLVGRLIYTRLLFKQIRSGNNISGVSEYKHRSPHLTFERL